MFSQIVESIWHISSYFSFLVHIVLKIGHILSLFYLGKTSITFRKKIYRTLDELQLDVDYWISQYNEQRPHRGKHCYGKTPMQTFREAKYLAMEKQIPCAELSDNDCELTVDV